MQSLALAEMKKAVIPVLIAVPVVGSPVVVWLPEDYTDLIEPGIPLEDNGFENVPEGVGVFLCRVEFQSFPDHHPLDPVEWSWTFKVRDVSRVKGEPAPDKEFREWVKELTETEAGKLLKIHFLLPF